MNAVNEAEVRERCGELAKIVPGIAVRPEGDRFVILVRCDNEAEARRVLALLAEKR